MTIHTHTERVTRLLRAHAQAAAVHEPSAHQSDATIRAMELAMNARRRRSSNARRAWAFAAAAVIIGAVGAGYQLRGGQPNSLALLARGEGLADENGAPLSVGARVEAGRAIATANELGILRYESGSEITLAKSSRLRLLAQGKRSAFALDHGRMFAHVVKLKPDEQFLVTTVDAEVEVRGTQFSVTVVQPTPGCESKTRVEVTEGVVAVRRQGSETLVRAGESFPVCAPPSSPAEGPPRFNVTDLEVAPSVRRPSSTGPETPDVSSLSAQNDLFAEAIEEKHKGQYARAAATLSRLMTKYPATPLRENALAERLRLLETIDPTQARQAAREYLRSFPQGFARDEASRLANEP